MDHSDWVASTGSAYVGLGVGGYRRPVNPKLLPQLATKARPAQSSALARQARRLVLRAVQLTGEVDDLLSPTASRSRSRAATQSPSIAEQSQPGPAGAAARLRHTAIVQRWRKPI
jgi:hypothetical protein